MTEARADDGAGWIVRHATAEDLPEIDRIYEREILGGTATFDLEPWPPGARAEWFGKFADGRHPLLVCEAPPGAGSRIAGFAYYLPYRAKAGYDATKETTIYVDPAFHRRGVATRLYSALIELARRRGVHVLVAVLGAGNDASEALHRKMGFREVGRYPEVGRKFGRWVDAISFVRVLGGEAAGAEDPSETGLGGGSLALQSS